MKTLVICRPKPDADPEAFRSLLPDEAAALRSLTDAGALLEAYSPGRPGAVLVLAGNAAQAGAAIAGLPLVVAGLLDVELIELHPLM